MSMKIGPIYKFGSVPAYSFGQKPKGDLGNINPGPGNYDWSHEAINIKNKNPSWGFGKQARGGDLGNPNPGPGNYDPSRGDKIKGGYLGSKGANQRQLSVPGPGSYDPNNVAMKQRNSPKYTMVGRGNVGNPGDNPGPGSYDPMADKIQHQSFSGKIISKAARDAQSKSYTPGPGNYDILNDLFSRKNGKFGNDKRHWEVSGTPNVGPGLYDQKSIFDEKKGWVMGKGERDLKYGNMSPGPGTYDYNASSFANRGWKQGTEPRDRSKPSLNPGPGNYDLKDNLFNNSYGKINPENKGGPSGPNNPGPGAYDADYNVSKNANPKFAFGKEKKRDIDSYVPGPGAYDGNPLDRKGFAMDRQDRNMKQGNLNPGPGAYDGNADGKFKGASKWGFGTEPRGKVKEGNQPGPGNYDIPHTIGDVSNYGQPAQEKRKIHL